MEAVGNVFFIEKNSHKYTPLIQNVRIKLVYQIVGIIQLKLIQIRYTYIYIYIWNSKMAFIIFQYTYPSYYSSYHVQSASRQSSTLKGTRFWFVIFYLATNAISICTKMKRTNKGETIFINDNKWITYMQRIFPPIRLINLINCPSSYIRLIRSRKKREKCSLWEQASKYRGYI